MVLLTKSIGIVTPHILSIVVIVALRLISYKSKSADPIVQESAIRSHRTQASYQIVSYMGFDEGREKRINKAVQCICVVK